MRLYILSLFSQDELPCLSTGALILQYWLLCKSKSRLSMAHVSHCFWVTS